MKVNLKRWVILRRAYPGLDILVYISGTQHGRADRARFTVSGEWGCYDFF